MLQLTREMSLEVCIAISITVAPDLRKLKICKKRTGIERRSVSTREGVPGRRLVDLAKQGEIHPGLP